VAKQPADLAVVIVNYNAGEYLQRCLESLKAAAGDTRLEIVVVDNASSDGSIGRARTAHGDVTFLVNGDNRGFSGGVNQGIRRSTAPFVLLMNPDAEISSGTLSALLKLAEDWPRVAAIGPLIRNPDGSVYPSGRVFPTILDAVGHAFLGPFRPDNRYSRAYTIADWDRMTPRVLDWVSLSCMLVRRSALQEVGLLDESFFLYGEELDLCTRFRDAGWEVLYTPEVEVTHAVGVSTSQASALWRQREHSKGVYRYFAKHRARGWRRILLPPAWLALRLRAEVVGRRRDRP
jgi:N-acetylglucosaminyl-diphospho-decaprenol L-rhamnosyltransferase